MDFPILSSLILLPTVGAIFILFVKSSSAKKYQSSKYVALFTAFANFLISIYLWYLFDNSIYEFQFVEEKQWLKKKSDWITVIQNYKKVKNISEEKIRDNTYNQLQAHYALLDYMKESMSLALNKML